MPRRLPYLLALLLGAAAALLVACGGGTKGGIPSASAGDLKSQIEDVQQAVEDGRCDDVPGQLRQVDDGIDDLPASVDDRLRERLRDAGEGLHRVALEECNERETQTQTTETTETQTTAPPTQTTPPETTTAPPETTTTPPETTTVVPPVVPPPPPPPVVPPPVSPPVPPASPPAPPPAGTPGGGATPEPEVGP